MFKRRPPYTAEEIVQVVSTLERLHKLRDMCIQKTVLQPQDRRWPAEVERYSRNIETSQRLLEHMSESNAKA